MPMHEGGTRSDPLTLIVAGNSAHRKNGQNKPSSAHHFCRLLSRAALRAPFVGLRAPFLRQADLLCAGVDGLEQRDLRHRYATRFKNRKAARRDDVLAAKPLLSND